MIFEKCFLKYDLGYMTMMVVMMMMMMVIWDDDDMMICATIFGRTLRRNFFRE